MTGLPDAVEWSALAVAGADSDDVELAPGERECSEFEQAHAAYDCRFPDTEVRMINAFKRFHQLGFDAYFQGAIAVPESISCRPQLASMWMDGFFAARMSALARRCDCDCFRGYRWGNGYDVCPRRARALSARSANAVAVVNF